MFFGLIITAYQLLMIVLKKVKKLKLKINFINMQEHCTLSLSLKALSFTINFIKLKNYLFIAKAFSIHPMAHILVPSVVLDSRMIAKRSRNIFYNLKTFYKI